MANRQAITSLKSGAKPRRLVHSSSVSRASLVASTAFEVEEPAEIVLAPIFDIFDAPSRLGESSKAVRENSNATNSRIVVDPSSSMFNSPRPIPPSLPPAVIFDGPARPRNIALAFHSRKKQVKLAPTITRLHHTPSVSSLKSSEPVTELFEGPARITRYHYKSSTDSNGNPSSSRLLLFGLAGAVGCATLSKQADLADPRISNSKSL